MPVTNRTVADVINDTYRLWRGELATEASSDERAAMRRAVERGARVAHRRYPFYFAMATATATPASGVVTIPAAASQIIRVVDSNSHPVRYTQFGTASITLIDDVSGDVTLEYKTNVPVYGTAETESIDTEIYDFLVSYTLAECWRMDRQYTKSGHDMNTAMALLSQIMSEIENQRGLKRRIRTRVYRGRGASGNIGNN